MDPASPPPRTLRDLVLATDWAATALGSVDGWSDALKTTVGLVLGARIPAIVFWGRDLVQVYNDGYAPLIGAKHPAALGQTAQECFPEIWDVIGPMLHGVLTTGAATWEQDQRLFLDRAGFAEECYFVYTFSPVGIDPIEGVFCVALETTAQVIAERRSVLLRDLASSLAALPSAGEVFDTAVAVLGRHRDDVLSGHLRILDGTPPQTLSWGGGDPARGGVGPAEVDRLVAAATAAGRVVVENAAVPSAPYQLGRPVVVAAPVARLGSPGPAAVLVMDVNPRIPFDLPYGDFVAQVAAVIGAALAVAEGFEAAARRARALEELDQAKTAFLSNISHEFRTPLTLLLGPLAAAADDDRLPADLRASMTMAQRNGRRVLTLVNSLLDISRLEAGRVAATYQPTNLSALTADLTSIFRGAAESAGLDLVIDCEPLGEAVHVDREMWEQIVTNLCANAVKFTDRGTVTVRLTRAGDAARLEVADTGIGIAAADLPFVFDRFRRAETGPATTRAGSGLGLALVRELVDRHGGRVTARSTPGVGSTFVVTVPFGTGHLDPAQVATGQVVAPRALSASPADVVEDLGEHGAHRPDPHPLAASAVRAEGGEATIWVVDDSTDMRDYLTNLLRPAWDVVAFAAAEPALDALAGALPDLILSDVMLPGASGLDLLAAVRADPATAGVPVLLLSARAGEEATLEGLRAGADDYLVKPFTARELVSRVRSNLHLAGVRREVGARALRHAAQLEALAGVAIQIISADTLDDIAAAAREFVRDRTSAGACSVTLVRPATTWPEPGEPGAGSVRIPLTADDGSALGSIDLDPRPGAELGEEDLRLVEQLALVASRRIENLLDYRRERGISHALQRSLLPTSLPRLASAEIVARYRPAVAAVDVGGDWYDALMLPDGRLMVTVGDVIGHDLTAAIAMNQIRLLLRALAADSAGPAELCSTVNRLLPAAGATRLATMVIAFIDPATGHTTMVNAGHPLPIVRSPDGVGEVAVPASLPLGVRSGTRYRDTDVVLAPGSMLLLYTDGLVERRTEQPRDSLDKLLRRVAELDLTDLGTAVDALLDAGGTDADDDIALLAVRRSA
ncbi:signal transduction histidine kinase/serine phosphatase RsbU (regulator of sigma subunit)/CheY-like chemotaxis protein [Allocatelliglobosispora scoriae]|uniref:histidine kinase n=1 Tax=Allocatelliglobosispora scoriae TaxID=643052 RepID=A0A841BJD5_9ACTN|nr:SpoIIE family protein phosphatase [Allocatelliglobosispora scoriae]MBB5866892.1 signal transduction histidine kinase/serine phosphatase RsbU (regulator of sigma subunit)/CheY-like chemotaxis protein [Allocatelliglobosispora scoriae]